MDTDRHNRRYSILLLVFAVSMACLVGSLELAKTMPRDGVDELPLETIKVYTGLQILNGCLAALALATSLLRFNSPPLGRTFSKILNFALLSSPPFGTALGVYGLFKVDRETES